MESDFTILEITYASSSLTSGTTLSSSSDTAKLQSNSFAHTQPTFTMTRTAKSVEELCSAPGPRNMLMTSKGRTAMSRIQHQLCSDTISFTLPATFNTDGHSFATEVQCTFARNLETFPVSFILCGSSCPFVPICPSLS